MQAFFDTFSKYITQTDPIILAVSGGVDSMALWDLVKNIHPSALCIIAHFDHSLRGEASYGDRDFIANICNKEKRVFEWEKMDIKNLAQQEKSSIEMTARKYRYAFLLRIAEKYNAHMILTAHHQDDRLETMMFNLLRGTKLSGITSLKEMISTHQSGINIFRPLLAIPKSDIIKYAEHHHIEYREDATNTDTAYLRNHLRHEVFPHFEKINPEYRHALEGFIEYSEELQHWIDDRVSSWLIDQEILLGRELMFRITDFQRESLFFQKELIRYLYGVAHHGTVGLSRGLIDEILRFITEGSNSYGKKDIKNLHLERRGDMIFVK